MNYGPLEFAAYLRSSRQRGGDSEEVKAARAAAPAVHSSGNRLAVISGSTSRISLAPDATAEAVSVYEAVAMRAPCVTLADGPVKVHVREKDRPVVLVLSSHQAVEWQLALAPGAVLCAVLLSGYGESTVAGAGSAPVSTIGGFYAFKRGSTEYRHLESEVMRCTGRRIGNFQSVYAGNHFEIGH